MAVSHFTVTVTHTDGCFSKPDYFFFRQKFIGRMRKDRLGAKAPANHNFKSAYDSPLFNFHFWKKPQIVNESISTIFFTGRKRNLEFSAKSFLYRISQEEFE